MTESTKPTPNEGAAPLATSAPALSLDWELFGTYLEASDLTDAQKREFIETLWSLVVNFVDLGLGLHPLQLIAGNSCEQRAEIARLLAPNISPVVSSDMTSNQKFNAAADVNSRHARESDLR
jgi:hypothetical protein